MKDILFLCAIWAFQFTDAQRKLYTAFKHVATGRYLSTDGTATVYDITSEELFDLIDAGNGQKFLLAAPWNEGSQKYAMDIQNGCRQNSMVKSYNLNKATNQRWILNSDGSIASACDPNWLLMSDNYGVQQVRSKDQIPAAERIWTRSQMSDPNAAASGIYGK